MMNEFDSGEMLRMPLDSVILMLKDLLNEDTTPALLDCLEPPDLSTIENSYNSLHKANFITEPNDDGDITVLGAFVSALGIDLALGALIGLGMGGRLKMIQVNIQAADTTNCPCIFFNRHPIWGWTRGH